MKNRRDFIKNTMAATATLSISSLAFSSIPKNKNDKLGLAIVGLGKYATEELSIGLENSDYWQATGLVTGSPGKIPEWKNKWNIKDENILDYENFDKLAERDDIDVVYICLPNGMHAEFTIRAAQAGKHVICEKPMAVSVAEAEQMIEACDKAGVKLAIGYRLHFNPFHQQVMAWGKNRDFGNIDLVDAKFSVDFKYVTPGQNSWRTNKALAGGGSLMDVGIYCVQASRYSTGEEPISVTAQLAPITDKKTFHEVENGISFQLEFPSGAYARCYSGYHGYIDELTVMADNANYNISQAFAYGPQSGSINGKPMGFQNSHHQYAQMEAMGPLFLSDAPMPGHISGVEGLKDIKVMTAIYEAVKTGKKITLS